MTPVLESSADAGRAAHVYVEISPYDKADQLFQSSYDFSGPPSDGNGCYDNSIIMHEDNNNNETSNMEQLATRDMTYDLNCSYGNYPNMSYSYDSSPLSLESHSPNMRIESLSPHGEYQQQQAFTTPTTSQPQQQPQRKGRGGRKKNLHPPSASILRHRRDAANARERKRMNGLNDAFERLREVVPNLNSEQKMSKIETLLMAQTYIKALAKLIETEDRKTKDYSEEVNIKMEEAL